MKPPDHASTRVDDSFMPCNPHSILDCTPVDMWTMDRHGTYTWQNSRCRAHWGNLVGTTVAELDVPSEQIAAWQSNDARALSGETVTGQFDVEFGGRRRFCMDILAPLVVDDVVQGIVGTNIDIAGALNAATQPSHQLQRPASPQLEHLGLLAAGVAHDFNDVLCAVSMGAEVAMGGTDDVVVRESLDIVRSASARGARIVEHLLHGLHHRDHQAGPVDVRSVCAPLLAHLGRCLPAGIVIEQRFSTADCTIVADPVDIERIVANLVTNAAQAMATTGGVVQVELCPEVADEEVVLVIKDHGRGIAGTTARRMWEPLQSTRDQGAGLGLWIVGDLVERNGGTVNCESRYGCGSRFEVRWPAAAPAAVK